MMTKYGSLHQYLLYLHDNGNSPISSFWWGSTHVVSVCSPQAFKESAQFVNRPRESNNPYYQKIMYIVTNKCVSNNYVSLYKLPFLSFVL